ESAVRLVLAQLGPETLVGGAHLFDGATGALRGEVEPFPERGVDAVVDGLAVTGLAVVEGPLRSVVEGVDVVGQLDEERIAFAGRVRELELGRDRLRDGRHRNGPES